ncbi:MAG: DUF3667 domain-containing protein [Pseudomonadota bacterium]
MKKIKATICQNCGTKLLGDHCHVCGQAATEPRRAVIGLVQDVFVDTLAIDGKLARTLGLLLSRPGRLARRYLEGQRVRYSPPFRLYLFASVFFFFTAFLVFDFTPRGLAEASDENISVEVDADLLGVDVIVDEERKDDLKEAIDDGDVEEVGDIIEDITDTVVEETSTVADIVQEELDSLAEDAAEIDADEDWDEDWEEGDGKSFKDQTWEDDVNYSGPDWFEPHAKKMFEAAQRVAEDPRLFVAQIRENLPRVLLLAPVLYAVILLLLYFYRRKFYVYDHFVVSLYMHAATYTYLLAAILLAKIPLIGGWLAAVPLIWGFFQPIMVYRQVYRSNWLSTILKWFIAQNIYLSGLAVILSLGAALALYSS